MKILHVINNLDIGGAEKQLIELLPFLQEKHKVDVLLLSNTDSVFKQELRSKLTGKIVELNSCLYNPMLIFKLKAHIRHYDIVHVHLFPSLYWVAFAKFFLRNIGKLVFTEHSTNNRRIENPILRKFDRVIYSQYDLIIAITPEVKGVLVNKLKQPLSKLRLIYNGINLEKFFVVKKNKVVTRSTISLIQVSRFSEAKDQNTVIKCLKLLPENYELTLIGDGRLKACSEELAVSLDLKHRVHFLGARSDIPELLSKSDIVIQSSNWEGFGLAAVEGMASGKPVIASNVPGLANIVGGYGILFEKGNFVQLAKNIKLLENPVFYNKVSLRCKSRSQSFSLKVTCDELLDCYDKLMN